MEVVMAKVGENMVMEGIRGKVGNLVFRLMPNGETWVSKNYDFSNRKFSRAQKSHQSRFQQAAAYARRAARVHPIYRELAKGTVRSPYNWALADWFNPPVIQRIEQTKGHIRVLATDNVRVTKVQVTILDKKGKVLEKGEGIKGKGDWWVYVSNAQGRIVAEAWDLAGNVAKSEN
jgi:hypothetical protein